MMHRRTSEGQKMLHRAPQKLSTPPLCNQIPIEAEYGNEMLQIETILKMFVDDLLM
jgi:hypothetical protein